MSGPNSPLEPEGAPKRCGTCKYFRAFLPVERWFDTGECRRQTPVVGDYPWPSVEDRFVCGEWEALETPADSS